MVRAAERTPDDQKWGAFLDAKGILTLDEFDVALLKGIEIGFFDPEAIRASAKKFEAQLELQNQGGSFEQAWRSYHDSFDNNEAEVVEQIYDSFQKNVQSISPMNLNGAVVLLRELGRNEKAEELIRYYLTHRSDPWKFWNLEESAFGDQVTDAAVVQAFKDRYQEMLPEANAADVLQKLARGQSLEDYEMAALIKLSADDYVSIFKSNRGESFSRLIYGALYYQRVVNANQETRDMTERVRAALAKIGSESPINRRRVRKYGIVLADETST